jgi:hypothetical protein
MYRSNRKQNLRLVCWERTQETHNIVYAPMIYKAPCVMFLMRADTLRGQVGVGSALEIEIFFGPFEMASSR